MIDPSVRHAVRRNSALLAVGQAASSVAFQVNSLIGSLAVFELSGNAALAGFVFSITWIGRILFSYASGWLMDRAGRKRVLILGGILTSISMVAAGLLFLAGDVTGLLASFLLYGTGNAILGQNRVAMTDMYEDSRIGTAVGYLYTSSILGSLVSIPVVMLVEPISSSVGIGLYSLMWFAGASALLFAVGTTAFLKPDTKQIALYLKGNRPKGANDNNSTSSTPLRSPQVIIAFVVSGLCWGIMVAMMSLLSLHMNDNGFPMTLISTAISVHVIGMYALSLSLGKMVDRLGSKKFMIVGSVLTGLGGLLTPLTTDYYAITFGIFLVGLGWSASSVSTTALIANATEVGIRGRVLGLNDMVTGIASATAPFAGGVVIAAEGFFGFGIYGMALSIPAILLAIVMKSDSRQVARRLV
ncbi:MAG: MFS transporter [Thaumarchaeota archaeon]|nr:MFS transporter [Nitrososphaerota archaeon]